MPMRQRKSDCVSVWKIPSQRRLRRNRVCFPPLDTENEASLSRGSTSEPLSSAESSRSTRMSNQVSNTAKDEILPGLYLTQSSSKIQLSGPAVNSALRDQLETWLKEKAKD